ncbi:GH39 family glycosyl hydrolase [Streptomyces sp. P17]|uniref:GH39 family glycosyl hydrolase n=1 Tax=Streptomyces sp. P17 TaxID=3074716 RepID=UPI0028F41C75|nr:xylan 1,4-beta-xylosidase [Streptomyces sp. P17]MDT9696201.1 xylan 1,4-beta-xylosidase [Streptomyces sp. P17]
MGRHGWNSGARRWRLTALLGVGVAALALVVTLFNTLPGGGASTEGTTRDGDKVHGTPTSPAPDATKPEVGWGFTHTQFSADEGDAAAVERVEQRLPDGMPQIQHIMGWGADNPEPVKGRYDFEAMDRRIDFVRASGGTPVVTLCCAPDWMKGGEAGVDSTDWSQAALETAPEPEYFDDFAALAVTVAKRYPDVRHFIVWNEFKGFWNDAEDRWDQEGYTKLYNLVYRALKKVNPEIMVGGPYLVMDSLDPREEHASPTLKGSWGAMDRRVLDAFTYWNEHKAGADFVVVDGSSYTRDDELLPDEFTATDKFTAVGEWVRRQTGGELPLWWAEYYVEPADGEDNRYGWSETRRTAVHAAGLIAMAKGGATSGFYWNPEPEEGTECPGCLWTPTGGANGGQKLPLYDLLARFAAEFPPGTEYEDLGTAPHVKVLATEKTALVVNTLGRSAEATVDGKRIKLRAYEVRWLERTAT